MKKVLRITGIALLALMVVAIVALLAFWLVQPLLYRDYYKQAKKEFVAAGLEDGLVPQGFSYIADQEVFVECGYMSDGLSASRIYLIDKEGETRFVELLSPDGTPYTGHTGGITVGERLVWLANDGEGDDNCVWVFPLAELLDKESDSIVLSEKFHPESRAACCYVDNGLLWVGEFYDPEKYPTKESHHLETPSGTVNPAFVCGYAIDETTPTGIADTTPKKILSVTERLQGFAVNAAGQFALSTSYGTSNSHLFLHQNVTQEPADTAFSVNGTEVPVWFLDEDSLIEDVVMPPMSEEIVCVDGRVYILYESACRKYMFGILTRGRHVYSYPF